MSRLTDMNAIYKKPLILFCSVLRFFRFWIETLLAIGFGVRVSVMYNIGSHAEAIAID